jgi:tryptophan synthase beta chain
VGPEHSAWHESGRVTYTSVSDEDALSSFRLLSEKEGIMPALETSHAVAAAVEMAGTCSPDDIFLINLSGRGDKDVTEAERLLESHSMLPEQ